MSLSNIKEAKNTLLDAIERLDRKMVYTTLVEYTHCDHISILVYDEQQRTLRELELLISIDIDTLSHKSLLWEAVYDKTIKLYKHITSDKNFNPAFDNLYNIKLKSQLVVPVVENNKLLGVIHFSKTIKTTTNFTHHTINNIKEIYPILIEMYSCIFGGYDETKGPFRRKTDYLTPSARLGKDEISKAKKLCETMHEKTINTKIRELLVKNMENLQLILDEMAIESLAENTDIQCFQNKKEKLNILIVDDTKLNISILKALINDQTHNIFVADDGDVALEKLKKRQKDKDCIDILFLDHHMPKMLGSEVVDHIMKKPEKYSTKKLYIISITNDPNAILEQKHLYDFHIRKPFMKTEIINVIEKIKVMTIDK